MPVVLRLLGRFEIATGSGDAVKLSGARPQLLLARLALAGGAQLDRSTLSTMLWGDRADAQARASLRQLIWTIRQTLEPVPDALVADGTSLRLDPVAVRTDVAEFDQLAKSGDAANLETALGLYRGDLLEGIDLIGLAPDGYFLQERNRLRDQALRVASDLIGLYDRDHQYDLATRAARRGLGLDPFNEALHGCLVDALQKLGRHREARDQDDGFRAMMQAEFGVTPLRPPAVLSAPQRATAARSVTPAEMSARLPAVGADRPTRSRVWRVAGGAVTVAAGVTLAIGYWLYPASPSSGPGTARPGTSEAVLIDRIPTRNLEAYDQYMRAEALRQAPGDTGEAGIILAAYRRAIVLDPEFADAYAGFALVTVGLWQGSLDGNSPSLTARVEAYEAAGHALQIDPGNARALIVLSRIQAEDGARDSALTSARRAVAAAPKSAEAHANLALLLSYAGNNSEARAELKLLQRLDPVPRPEWLMIFGQVAFADGRYDGAIADFVSVWPEMPRNALMLEHLAAALSLQGRIRLANQFKDSLMEQTPTTNLHRIAARYASLLSEKHLGRLLEGLRRAGVPDWPYGFKGTEAMRLTGPELAAITTDARWSGQLGDGSAFQLDSDAEGSFTYRSDTDRQAGRQFLREEELCLVATDRPAKGEICGPIFRAASEQDRDSEFVFVSADEVRYFSVSN
ncbi:MAG: BTAD domain-containing putative transcriptional regulator [bacterium]